MSDVSVPPEVAADQAAAVAAEPASPPAPKPDAVTVVTALQAALNDLSVKKAAAAAAEALVKDAEAVVSNLRTDWQGAVADIEAAFSGIESVAAKFVKEVESVL